MQNLKMTVYYIYQIAVLKFKKENMNKTNFYIEFETLNK